MAAAGEIEFRAEGEAEDGEEVDDGEGADDDAREEGETGELVAEFARLFGEQGGEVHSRPWGGGGGRGHGGRILGVIGDGR